MTPGRPPSDTAADVLRITDGELSVGLEPQAGGRISSVMLHRPDVELLFAAPWAIEPLRTELPSIDRWTGAWAGGWHLLFPNAGEACLDRGRAHGYHGAASVSHWRVEHRDATTVSLRFRDVSGLEARRTVSVLAGTVDVITTVLNAGVAPAEFVVAEHLILGPPLVGEGMRVSASGSLTPLHDDGTEVLPDEEPRAWPGTAHAPDPQDWSGSPGTPVSRFGVLSDLAAADVSVTNGKLSARIRWSGDRLPHLWFWHESLGTDAWPGGHRIRCLGLEPSTVGHSRGLDEARRSGGAIHLEPGTVWQARVRLTPARASVDDGYRSTQHDARIL